MSIINVSLYGGKSPFGGKETPLEAVSIHCDKFETCSYYKDGTCRMMRSFNSGCKFGRVSTVKGYTSRAQKYYKFKSDWQGHEKYGKLKTPPQKLGLIDGHVVFDYSYVKLREEDGEFQVKPSLMFDTRSASFIPLEKFTNDLIRRICSFRPMAMMGGEITDYQKKEIPTFLAHFKEIMPDRYAEYVAEFPQYDKEINYVGRTAFLKTVNPGPVEYRPRNYANLSSDWVWNGDHLIYKKGYVSSFSVVNDYSIASIVLEPTDTTTIKITRNDQVGPDTTFKD